MKFFNKTRRITAIAAASVLLASSAWAQTPVVIKVGTFPGPFEQVTRAAAKAAEREGLKIEPVVFNNAVLPNDALAAGEIQANQYQHAVYLASEIKRRGYKIHRAADIFTVPLAIYSKKHKKLADLPNGARVVVPSDEANQHRALLAFQSNGLIKLRADFDPSRGGATLRDIQDNPKKLEFVEAAVPAIPKLLDDLDAGAVNANTAFMNSKLTLKEAIAVESQAEINRYPSLLAVRDADKNAPWVAALIRAYKSPEVRQVIEQNFNGTMVPLF